MSVYWSDLTRSLKPYVPGEQPRDRKYIKINTNECPYPPSQKVLEAIKAAAGEELRLYPDPDCNDLRQTAADYYGLSKDQVFAGNGSDELLAFSFMAFFDPGRPILFNDITYSFYPVYAQITNIQYRTVPLNDDFTVPVEGFMQENGGIVIANPNAPTSLAMPLEDIRRILEANTGSVVIIDEAYVDFGAESAVSLINGYPNLLVIQTLSKSRSLAGLRIGLAMGHRDLIEGLDRIKNSINSYTLDRLALAGAVQAIRDEEYFRETCQKVMATRDRTAAELRRMGFSMPDSSTNFLFITHPDIKAAGLFGKLRERGILVRYFDKPRIDNYLRVSIGTDDDMNYFLETVRDILKSG